MTELAAQGLAVVMISSELPEILGMSDRIVVMHAGRVVKIVERSEATQQNILGVGPGTRGMSMLSPQKAHKAQDGLLHPRLLSLSFLCA